MSGHERTVRGAAVTWFVHPDGSTRIARLGDAVTVSDADVERFDRAEGLASPADPADAVAEPARAGRGSARTAWADYAATVGVAVDDGMSRDDIIAAVDKAASP